MANAVPLPTGMDFLNPYLATIDRAVANSVTMNNLSVQTGIHRAYIASIGLLFLIAFVFFGLGASVLSTVVGVAYPAYMSFLAIESPDKADDPQWLTYWVVFATFSLVETVGDILLFWFPFYYTVKVAFLIYLQMPYTRGAEFIYKNYLRGFFNANRHYLESFFGRLRGTASTAASELRGAQSELVGMATAAALERGVAGLTQRPVQQPDLNRIFGAAPVGLGGQGPGGLGHGQGAGGAGGMAMAGGKDA